MALVDYSDSDKSDIEVSLVPKTSVKPSKGSFQRVVNRSNPGKIRVSLPQAAAQDPKIKDERPVKRIKAGGSGLTDFKSFLPPPKRTGQNPDGGLGNGNVLRKGGSVASISLKTGAAPGFSTKTNYLSETQDSNLADLDREGQTGYDASELGLPPAKNLHETAQKPAEEVKLVGKPLMFRPLSVARNPAKKKTKKQNEQSTAPTVSGMKPVSSTTRKVEPSPQKPKISLFSILSDPSDSIAQTSSQEYQPIIYGVSVDAEQDAELPTLNTDIADDEYNRTAQTPSSGHGVPNPGAQSLHDIAFDLNLSAADRRQLFGRQKGGAIPQATKIINFNTDEEYRHNEELRSTGEQVTHNPVRAIAPGKHSLKQLLNAAANQKEALEESFAKGKSNKADASSRYGW